MLECFFMKKKAAVRLVSWSFFDFAAKFFTLNIVTVNFVVWLTVEKQVANIFYGLAFGLSSLIVLLLSPLVGKISDLTGKKREIFSFLIAISSIFIVFLGFTDNPVWALIFFALANLAIQLGVIVYNALIVAVAPAGKIGFVSGFGKMVGFAGAVLILVFSPSFLETYGYHPLFWTSGLLLFLFSLPCMILVKEKKVESSDKIRRLVSFQKLVLNFKSTLQRLKILCKLPGVKNLLIASFFILCPLNALILFLVVYLEGVFGLGAAERAVVIIWANASALFGSIVFGSLGDRIGYKKTIYISFFPMFLGFIFVALMTAKKHSYYLGVLFGLIYGAIMSVPRALAVTLVSEKEVGEFFGFFAWMGYLAAFAGPLVWGVIDLSLGFMGDLRYRIAIILLGLFIFPSLYYFKRVPEKGGKNG